MELLKDYDVTIQYLPGKSNVMENTLSRKSISMESLAYFKLTMHLLYKEFQTLAKQLCNLGCYKEEEFYLVVNQG